MKITMLSSPQHAQPKSDPRARPHSDIGSILAGDLGHLLQSLSEGVIVLDRDWRITYANESARRISRIEPHFIDGPSHWELYPATVGTAQEEVYRTSMERRVSLEHEFYYSPYDIWISLQTLPVPSGIAVVYRDITRLKNAEGQRKQSDRQLQQLFDATTDAVALLDRNYNITYLNRRARELLSPSGEVLGKNLWESFPATVYEDSPYVSAYHRAMEQRITGSFEAYYPDPLNVWLSVEARPTEEGITVFFRDITTQRKSAEDLKRKTAEAERQAAEIEALYKTAPIGLALFDTEDFRYLRLNDRQAAFFGLEPEQVAGRTLTEMAPIPGLRELFEEVRAGNAIVNYPLEGELINDPGEHRYWTVNYSPIRAADGTVRAIAAASLEVTQQKRAERALIQSEKLAAVGRLASSISHEINNPLESVTNLLYLISSRDDLLPEVRHFAEMAQEEVARVSQIATQTLRFYRQAAKPTPTTAAQLAEPVLNLFRGRLRNAQIRVETRFSSGTTIYCLENEIRQVLSNLIANAIDATRKGGKLMVRSHDVAAGKQGGPGIRITVADTGHGMTQATRRRIFEPFFTTKELNGTGLGLWVSANVIERHQGSLTVRSSQGPVAHGTVFSVFLPVRAPGLESSGIAQQYH
jgi:PAS domain S-box-containing protein